AIIVKPFGYTRDHDPSRVWSVAGSNDPLHGPFHEYLKRFDINNTDTDYGQGLVITWGEDKLDMPVHLQNGENYTIFVRYLQNEAAGKISIAIDNDYERILSTNGQSNRFIWENIGTTYLSEGRHVFQLQNGGGFNAVNLF